MGLAQRCIQLTNFSLDIGGVGRTQAAAAVFVCRLEGFRFHVTGDIMISSRGSHLTQHPNPKSPEP